MSRPRLTLRRLALVAALGLLLANCNHRDEPATVRGWVRLDLSKVSPTFYEGAHGGEGAHLALTTYLGASEVRDLALVPPDRLRRVPKQSAGQIRAIEQQTGTRLGWEIELGQDGYFSFIPLGPRTHRCPCGYKVSIQDAAGREVELARSPRPAATPLAPPTVTVDLGRYAGDRITLLLEIVTSKPGRARTRWRALWGSPAVYSRKQVPSWPAVDGAVRPSVILITVDALRADHLGAYGRHPSLTPALDHLARESDLWLHAYSTFNVTSPSFASLMTGLYGKDHRVYDLWTPLPDAHTTLAELFHEAGYDTMAVIAAQHVGDHNSGLGQGFAETFLAEETFAAEAVVDTAMNWLAERDRAFFLWLHLFDPHTPHAPPEPFASGLRPRQASGLRPIDEWVAFREPGPAAYQELVLAADKQLYAGEIAYVDRQIDRLLGFLRGRGILENTVLAIVADHGENLGEHGINFRHGGLFETTLHVPLMIRWPGHRRTGRRLPGLVQHLDLFPTLLAACGIKPPASRGVDLRDLEESGGRGPRFAFSEHASRLGTRVRAERYSYYVSSGNPLVPDGPHLYDLRFDPGETHDLAGAGLAAERELAGLLARWQAETAPEHEPSSVELDRETVERLRSLGYLQP